jgi:hypothetical protein
MKSKRVSAIGLVTWAVLGILGSTASFADACVDHGATLYRTSDPDHLLVEFGFQPGDEMLTLLTSYGNISGVENSITGPIYFTFPGKSFTCFREDCTVDGATVISSTCRLQISAKGEASSFTTAKPADAAVVGSIDTEALLVAPVSQFGRGRVSLQLQLRGAGAQALAAFESSATPDSPVQCFPEASGQKSCVLVVSEDGRVSQ